MVLIVVIISAVAIVIVVVVVVVSVTTMMITICDRSGARNIGITSCVGDNASGCVVGSSGCYHAAKLILVHDGLLSQKNFFFWCLRICLCESISSKGFHRGRGICVQ